MCYQDHRNSKKSEPCYNAGLFCTLCSESGNCDWADVLFLMLYWDATTICFLCPLAVIKATLFLLSPVVPQRRSVHIKASHGLCSNHRSACCTLGTGSLLFFHTSAIFTLSLLLGWSYSPLYWRWSPSLSSLPPSCFASQLWLMPMLSLILHLVFRARGHAVTFKTPPMPIPVAMSTLPKRLTTPKPLQWMRMGPFRQPSPISMGEYLVNRTFSNPRLTRVINF